MTNFTCVEMEEDEKYENWLKNQDPSSFHHSHFDVDFHEEITDPFYLSLNNIEREFLENEQNILENPPGEFKYIDPRTGKECPEETLDYSNNGRSVKIFDKYPKKSCMKPSEHKATIKYLLNQEREGSELQKKDSALYHQSEQKRSMERTMFHEFLKEYSWIHYSDIYKPLEEFENLYKKKYKHFANKILSQENENFSIISGLPLIQNVTTLEENITDLKISRKEGFTRKYNESMDFKELAFEKEKHFSTIEEEFKIFPESFNSQRIIFHEEALITLIAASLEIESLFSLIFEIHENLIHFKKPFPSRMVNLRTSRSIFKDILDTFHAIPGKCEFVSLCFSQKAEDLTSEYSMNSPEVSDDSESENSRLVINDTESCKADFEEISYKLEPIEKFLKPISSEQTKKLSNQVDVNFTLKDLKITLQKNVPFCFHEGNQTLMNFSPKLEFKSSFGCEVMTKYELLAEWVAQKFLPNSLTCRMRLDARTFQKIHSQMISINEIEEELEFRYNIKASNLLGSIHNFLTIILKLLPGKYLLNHCEKTADKFMVYKKTDFVPETESKGTKTLHSIFQEEISSFEFFQQRKYIGIDHRICSVVHLSSNCAPCAFPFWIKFGTSKPIQNDRDLIFKKEAKKQAFLEGRRKLSKKKKKSRRRREKKDLARKEDEEKMELEEDVRNDIKLGIC